MKSKLTLLFAAILLCTASSFATTHMVMVADFAFSPATLNAQVGDTIMFMWSSGSHTTTSTSVPSGAASWDTPMTSTSTMFNYKITVAGTYTYKCTPHSSMGMVGAFTATGATGVETVSNTDAVSLYPNPVTNTLHVDLKGMTGMVNILITDAAGRTVSTTTAKGGNPITMETNSLPAGLYVLKAVAGQVQEAHAFSIVR